MAIFSQLDKMTSVDFRNYNDLNHNLIDRTVTDFHARVVQHDCDHLDGILYPMRIEDLSNFGFSEVLFPDSDLQDD